MARILVLIDGVHTHELLAQIQELTRIDESELILLYVRGRGPRVGLNLMRHRPGRPPIPAHRERVIESAEQARGADALDEAEEILRASGSSAKRIEADGEPGHVVCDYAGRERADVVVVRAAGRDQPALGPRSLGPTARYVADHCPCPVLLLRGRR
jgi:nucleotide-binding universal stress UspA family protein